MLSERLSDDEILALIDGVSPGPWVQGFGWIGRVEPEFECLVTYGLCSDDMVTDGDAALMAAASTLAHEVLALRAQVAQQLIVIAAHNKRRDGTWAVADFNDAPLEI